MPQYELRKHLLELLDGGGAHITFNGVVEGFPVAKAGIRPPGSPHSAWELLEHIRIALEDIVLYSGARDTVPLSEHSGDDPKGYVRLIWPGDYWPKTPAPASDADWHASVAAIERSMGEFTALIEDPERDLFQPFPWGDGQTLLREALVIADHNSYHLGQLLLVRRMVDRNG